MNPTHTDINAQRLHSFAGSSLTDSSNPQQDQSSPQKPTSHVFRFRDSTYSGGSEPESPQTGYFPGTTTDESPDQEHSNIALAKSENNSTKKKKLKGEMVFHIEGEDSEYSAKGDNSDDEEPSPEVRPRARNDRVVYSPKGTAIGTRTQNKKEDNLEEEFQEVQPRTRNTRVVFSPRGGDANRNTVIEVSDGATVIKNKETLTKSFVGPSRKSDLTAPNSFIGDPRRSTATHSLIYSQTDDRNSILISEQNKFTDKSQWTENLKCYVCCKVFDKTQGINTHHCRACGKAVCGDCSRKKINNDRACDVCYKKAIDSTGEAARSNRLLGMLAKLQARERQLEEMKQSLKELQKKKKDIEKNWVSELNEKANLSRILQDEKRQEKDILDKKKEENEKLKQEIEVKKKYLKEREEKNNEVQDRLSEIKSELSRRKNLKNAKIQECEQLEQSRRCYNPSVLSVVRVSIVNDASFLQGQS